MENVHIPDVQNMPKGLIFHKMDYKSAKKYTKPPFKQKNGIPRSFNQNPVSILAKKSQIQAMFFIFSEFTRTNPKLLHMMILKEVTNMLDIILNRKELLSRTLDKLAEKIASLPEGSILIKHQKGTSHFIYYKGSQKTEYLSKSDQKLIKNLAQKRYLKLAQKAAKQEAEALCKAIELYPKTRMENVYDELPSELKEHAIPLVPNDEQFAAKWQAEPFKPKPFKKDAPEFYTMKGERVRSKSEVIIADRLYAKGIPYKYECPLRIGKEIIHPDFTILRMSDRKVLYHEHCGKMTDPGYTKDIPIRANKYISAGIFQGDRLFYTFESAECPLNVKDLDEFIENNYR